MPSKVAPSLRMAARDRPRADGSWRDTAVYSIVVDEWPQVRAALEARLATAVPPTLARESTDHPR
jgi:hypothetical protein